MRNRCATYCRFGNGSSRNALAAAKSGRLPLSRAVPLVAKAAGVTQKIARKALEHTWGGEWHHTSKFANETPFYSVEDAVDFLRAEQAHELPADKAFALALEDGADFEFERIIKIRSERADRKREGHYYSFQARLENPRRKELRLELVRDFQRGFGQPGNKPLPTLKDFAEHRFGKVQYFLSNYGLGV